MLAVGQTMQCESLCTQAWALTLLSETCGLLGTPDPMHIDEAGHIAKKIGTHR